MLARIASFGLTGLEGYPVEVQVDISGGLPAFETVGLPDAAVKESRERVRSAIKNTGLQFPTQRITVNLAPAHVKKEGPIYDLPIAAGLLAATGQVPGDVLQNMLLLGELSLDGRLMPIMGVLPMLIAARKQGACRVVLPPDNAQEAAFVSGLDVYTPQDLGQLAKWLRGEIHLEKAAQSDWEQLRLQQSQALSDLAMVRGQENAKRALEIAAAGGHNLLMIGPPGSGKTLLARCLPSILPDLTFDEAMEVTQIHSVAGTLGGESGFITTRPFRSPHHTVSAPALTGGGPKARPGEVSLAHNGVLFLDELPEFGRDGLEALRQPLEDGFVTVSRVQMTVRYPARFMLVAAMNPCPCGQFGSRDQACRCTPPQIRRYLGRVSGPLLDRIDLQIEVEAVPVEKLEDTAPGESSATVRQRVNRARQLQLARYRESGLYCNAQLDSRGVMAHCRVTSAGQNLLRRAFSQLGLSARTYHRILKVARTIADLAGEKDIQTEHLAEAIQYRSLDRKYW
nr:YifB family Mg chelatase-like AAA ATPase [bacterium]